MALKITPDKFALADARRLFFRSRTTVAVVFTLFLALGVYLASIDSALTLSIGTSLIAGGVISLATLWIEQIRNGEEIRMKDLIQTGLVAAYRRRNLTEEYDALVKDAKVIDVTGYTLKSFSEQNEEVLRERARKRKPIRVRVLLVDPDSEASRIMEAAENQSAGQYAGSRDALLKALGDIKGVEVRLSKRHLSMMIYRIDNTLFTGPYPASAKSANAFTLRIGQGWLFQKQMDDFDALWKAADVVVPSETKR
ncbi:hypothetical protein AU05_01105 [Ectopseudomonas composti]|uniref:Uncharacterized protein n=1 Tax=Ectopseudomonas composti TaxID=658457 RepID=A0ABN0S6K1_9GAMM|nr:hypothetical protein [Pseudomonas composti]EZH77033.1 hypothetical protein AU05_01105 [Pseudomonas composti]